VGQRVGRIRLCAAAKLLMRFRLNFVNRGDELEAFHMVSVGGCAEPYPPYKKTVVATTYRLFETAISSIPCLFRSIPEGLNIFAVFLHIQGGAIQKSNRQTSMWLDSLT